MSEQPFLELFFVGIWMNQDQRTSTIPPGEIRSFSDLESIKRKGIKNIAIKLEYGFYLVQNFRSLADIFLGSIKCDWKSTLINWLCHVPVYYTGHKQP